jgi:YidC/Oxa1 family membrane protein insertase
MDIFNALLVQPILNILVLIYQGLSFLHIPSGLAFSIILLTILVRFVMFPLMHASLKQQKKMQEIQPHLNKLKEKHKNDLKMQQTAQMELFKEHGVNPASGCLIGLVQIPLFIALYQVLDKLVNPHHMKLFTKIPDPIRNVGDLNNHLYSWVPKLNHLWDTTFLGIPLGHAPSQILPLNQLFINLHWAKGTEHAIPTAAFAILLIPVLTGGLQLIQSKMMMSPSPVAPYAPEPVSGKGKEEDAAVSIQKQMMLMMPLMIGFFSFSLPFGLSLYWNTLTIFGIIQQYLVGGWGGMTDWFGKKK